MEGSEEEDVTWRKPAAHTRSVNKYGELVNNYLSMLKFTLLTTGHKNICIKFTPWTSDLSTPISVKMDYVELVLPQLPTWPVVIIMLVGLCPVCFCLCLSARALCILLWPRTWLTCQLPTQKPASAFFLTACSLWGAFLVLLSGNPSSLQHSQLNWSSPSSEKTSSQSHHPCSHIPASQEQSPCPTVFIAFI